MCVRVCEELWGVLLFVGCVYAFDTIVTCIVNDDVIVKVCLMLWKSAFHFSQVD